MSIFNKKILEKIYTETSDEFLYQTIHIFRCLNLISNADKLIFIALFKVQ